VILPHADDTHTEQTMDGKAGARFRDDRRARLHLWRTWSNAAPLGFLMLNPSIAGVDDDPTITRCIGFARREGAGGIVVCNLSPIIATNPRVLYGMLDAMGMPDECPAVFPIGHREQRAAAFAACTSIVAAWGAFAGAGMKARACLEVEAGRAYGDLVTARGHRFFCLGVTAGGGPRHPLYLANDTPMLPWGIAHV